MFERLREKWRKSSEAKAAKKAIYAVIDSGDPAQVKKALDEARQIGFSDEDKGLFLKAAINNHGLPVFKEVLAFVDDPNTPIKWSQTYGQDVRHYNYAPIAYAIEQRTHDISLFLANNPRVNISGEQMDSAKNQGMGDVALVLMQRIADLKRREAAQLEKEAGQAPPAAATDPAAALPAPQTPGMIEEDGETWALMAKNSVARLTSSPAIARKLTEIFNFESSERVLITENLKTGAETIGNPEKFDNIAPAVLQRAQAMHKALTAESTGKKFTL